MKIPKVETLIVFVFFACVALWAISKCSSERSDFVRSVRDIGGDEEQEERPKRQDSVVRQQPAQPTTPVQAPPVNTQSPAAAPPAVTTQSPSAAAPQPGAKPSRPALSNRPDAAATQPPTTTTQYSTLYVSIDGLNVRKEPGLKSETIAKLALYEPVKFLNQKTEWTQELNLGNEKITDHWVKIRTQSGKEGWVFGAGVHYYKIKKQ